jgi:hypothetical protein
MNKILKIQQLTKEIKLKTKKIKNYKMNKIKK